jgi:hypothetical protein
MALREGESENWQMKMSVSAITKTRLYCFMKSFSSSQELGFLLKENPLSRAPIEAKKGCDGKNVYR